MAEKQIQLNIKNDLLKQLEKKIELLLKYKHKTRLTPVEIKKIGENVRTLSSGLTESRSLAGEQYMDKNDLLDAYLFYYYPVSYAQTYYTLKSICLEKKQSALDIGAGPGPVAMALSDYGFNDITCVDYSKNALQTAAGLLEKPNKKIRTTTSNLEQYRPETGSMYDCITFGHCINELWKHSENRTKLRADFLSELLKHLTPEGALILIEPGANSVNRELLSLRDEMIERNFHIMYPCICKTSCPALAAENGSCHSEYIWERPALIRDIAKAAGVKKEILNMTILVFSNKPPVTEESYGYRVISDRILSKSGRYRFICCGNNGRITISVKKDDTISCYANFINLKRGDKIEVTGYEERENGFALTEKSSLKIIEKIR